jgi:SOR/SNZ family
MSPVARQVLTPADDAHHINKHNFKVPFVCGCRDLGEALRRIAEGAAMIRTKGENHCCCKRLLACTVASLTGNGESHRWCGYHLLPPRASGAALGFLRVKGCAL